MRENITKVIDCFKAGRPCKGDSKGTCSTDGKTIYSYAMPIAWKVPGGVHVVPYEAGPSRTTKSQIRACQLAFAGMGGGGARARTAGHRRHAGGGANMVGPNMPYYATMHSGGGARSRVTLKAATDDFKENILPSIKRHERPGHIDYPMRSEQWNIYIDNLHRSGQISDHQVNTWPNPFARKR